MNPPEGKRHETDPGGKVLLVDEDSEYLEYIRRITEGMGHSVHACNSYAEGIRQLECGAFKLVVVGQGSRFFEGVAWLNERSRSTGSCPSWWWHGSSKWSATWKRCSWERLIMSLIPLLERKLPVYCVIMLAITKPDQTADSSSLGCRELSRPWSAG